MANSSNANEEKEFQIMLDYLGAIEPLQFCGLTFGGNLFSGKALGYFADFLKKANNLKVVFFTQNGYGGGSSSQDDQV